MSTKPDQDSCGASSLSKEGGLLQKMKKINLREVFTWRLVRTLAMGQGLAGLVCGTALSSQYLASSFQVNAPMLQSVLSYALMAAAYSTALMLQKGEGNLLRVLRSSGWKYLLLGLVDVEANYTVVKAYQYTTLTSVQLLDCFVIPVLMLLSWCILGTRYRPVHYAAVGLCLLGVGAMVGADLLAGRDQGSTSNLLLGDGLVLLSAALYAVSNVAQEQAVRRGGRGEFLGMIGLFGTLISTTQMLILEHNEISNIDWSWEVGLLFSSFALCMFLLYSLMPAAVRLSSATSVNLSLLTADLFSLFCGLLLFHYQFSGLYLVSLVVILIGFITFNAVPTPTNPTDPEPSSSSSGEAADPPVETDRDSVRGEVTVRIQNEEDSYGEELCGCEDKESECWGKKKRKRSGSGASRKHGGRRDREGVPVGRSTKL